MELATLFVELVKAAAWPIVALFVLRTVRKLDLKALADRVKSAKIGPVEVQMIESREVPQLPPPPAPQLALAEGTAKATGESTAKASGEVKPTDPPMPEPSNESLEVAVAESTLVEHAPAGAIVVAWARFEEVAHRAADRVIARPSTPYVLDVLREFQTMGVIDLDTFKVIQRLRGLRNEVAHSGGTGARVPTVAAAQAYVSTIDDVIFRVQAGANMVRTKQLLDALGNPPPAVIRVSRLAASGVSSTEEGARAMAANRRGQWGARSFGVTMMISEYDAGLLLAYGATQVRNVESDED